MFSNGQETTDFLIQPKSCNDGARKLFVKYKNAFLKNTMFKKNESRKLLSHPPPCQIHVT